MTNYKNRLLIYIDDELAEWMEGKAREGYKKAVYVRRLMEKQMENERQVLPTQSDIRNHHYQEKPSAVQSIQKVEGYEPLEHFTVHNASYLPEDDEMTVMDFESDKGEPRPTGPFLTPTSKKLARIVRFCRVYPWAIEKIIDPKIKEFVVYTIPKIEAKLPIAGPRSEKRRGRPAKGYQTPVDPWSPDYKPQRGPNGEKLGTPRSGARYVDMETQLAVQAWKLDYPGEPMPRWLYDAETQWIIAQHKKTHQY
jgi:hypothetical protein